MTLLGYSADGEVPYLVYEFLSNGTLEDAIEYKVKVGARLRITLCHNISMHFQLVVLIRLALLVQNGYCHALYQ